MTEEPDTADLISDQSSASALPNVIIGGTPLLGRLTGIGHYTRQLVSALHRYQLVSRLRLWGDISFIDDDAVLTDETIGVVAGAHAETVAGDADSADADSNAGKHPSSGSTWKQAIRQQAAKSYTAARCYTQISERVAAYRLRPFTRDHVYHSPNFILPPYSGPKVITVHDLSVLRYPEFHRRQMVELCEAGIRRAIEEDAQIIVDSDVVRQELLAEFSLVDVNITTVPLAPDERCRPRSEAECRSTLRRFDLSYGGFFLCVGTVEPRKNLSRVFEAYRVGREEKLFDWPLVVVGGRGWKSASEHEALEKLCDRGWARYLHYLDDLTLHDLYAATGLLVFPSLYEGFGLPAAEAAASGSRVLTSLGSAMAEFLGDFATLVDPLDVEAIKKGLRESSVTDANQDLPKVLNRTWQEVATETAAVYQKALSDRPS